MRRVCAAAWLLVCVGACQAPAGAGESCTRNADCGGTLTCAFGRCRDACRESRDCALGSRCIVSGTSGVCALDQENHCDTAVCPAPLACVVDQCETSCTLDTDCISGPCVGGTCAEPVRGAPAIPSARLAASAFYTDWYGPMYGTPGMSRAGFEIRADGVHDGELLLLIGCVDNGSSTAWPSPIASGFTQLDQDAWGSDLETCVVAWKIAASEPATYAGTYGSGIVSGSSVLALVAVSGARSVGPIADYLVSPTPPGTNTDPVIASSPGIDTTEPDTLVLFAASADWTCAMAHSVSASVPSGFTTLLHMGDQGNDDCDWTWLQIESMVQHASGPTGQISATQTSTPGCTGSGWTATIAIEH